MVSAKERRHQGILQILQETGTVTVAELGTRLGVTEMTIRRDLELLEADGVLKRFHGGARLAFGSSYEPPFPAREKTNAEHKRAIGERIAAIVNDGDTIILDGGSTGVAVAECLVDRELTICPLSLRVAWAFARSTTVNLIIPSGSVRQGELSLSGADTIDYLRGHHFDSYIMTASGMSLDQGFTEWNPDDAAVKKAAVSVADKTVAAVDSSKYDRVGFVRICPTKTPAVIVTDSGLTGEQLDALQKQANEVILTA
ncbi:DeoR/GlpR family transcriptional regulator of sugar metabolism [Arthrobacter globiformis]|uniref:DeoR/GlpR family DNA-binding transcription regulator n=1 Tax=Arthrobacter globiformis TaxID=1665 RepID=UPI002781AD2A|nr:DeoR/GlpR family DNA-binding transcription regulator [Arthrobacter globiformis]MDQ1060843.1 DeoR/GlpR family transcriptional regulator of sugar metabolism [Arthrobacter globiformis]